MGEFLNIYISVIFLPLCTTVYEEGELKSTGFGRIARFITVCYVLSYFARIFYNVPLYFKECRPPRTARFTT